MYHVLIEDLQTYAYHGVPEAEREVGHRYSLDLDLEVAGSATETDRVEDTVDYAAVAKLAIEIAQTEQFRTVERLARVIGQRLLKTFPKIEAAEVTVTKPYPPMPFVAVSAGAHVRTTRKP